MPDRGEVVGPLVAAVEFYTRVPRPTSVRFERSHAAAAAAWAPLAGWLVAAVSVVVWWLASRALPEPLPVLLAVSAGVWFTGALHEDGFADVCDAFGAPGDAARTLAILKDPRAGAYAVVGLALLLATRVAALWQVSLLGAGSLALMGATLLAGHGLSRFVAVTVTRAGPYARRHDAGARAGDFAAPLTGAGLAVAASTAALSVLPLVVLGLHAALLGLLLVVSARAWLVALFLRRIGGFTGDCLGCVQQVSELIVYLGVVAALMRGGVA
jgi:adenosylcobinamide-GDP ribazoletransferase